MPPFRIQKYCDDEVAVAVEIRFDKEIAINLVLAANVDSAIQAGTLLWMPGGVAATKPPAP